MFTTPGDRAGRNLWTIVAALVKNWKDAVSTTGANTSVSAVSWSVIATNANAHAIIVPKGTGGLLLNVPDATATGGNARGINAIDLTTLRSVNTSVAAGANSIAIGRDVQSSGNYSVAIGGDTSLAPNVSSGDGSTIIGGQGTSANANSATNTNSVNIGCTNLKSTGVGSGAYSVAGGTVSGQQAAAIGGQNHTLTGVNGFGHGNAAVDNGLINVYCHGGNPNAANGDVQFQRMILSAATTGVTAKVMTANGSLAGVTNQLILSAGEACTFRLLVSGINTANNDACGFYVLASTIRRTAGVATTAFAGAVAPTVTLTGADATVATAGVTLAADTTNGGLGVTATGPVGVNMRWSATLDYTVTK